MKIFKIRFDGVGIHLSSKEARYLMVTMHRYSQNKGPIDRSIVGNYSFHIDLYNKIKPFVPFVQEEIWYGD